MKNLKCLFSAIFLSAFLSSCAAAPESATTSLQPVFDEKVTLSCMACMDWVSDAELELAREFDSQYDIGIEYQIFPSNQYYNLLLTKLNTGECPDIFMAQSGRFDIGTQYNVEKNAVDLSDASWAQKVDSMAAGELTINGRLYGQPAQDTSAIWAIGYNKQIFNRLHLSVPHTYEEFTQVCETIQDAGITPIYECLTESWHHTLWFVESCVVQETIDPGYKEKLNNNTASFAGNSTFLKILNQIQDMVNSGYWGEHYITNSYDNAPDAIASGEYAMVVYNQGLNREVHAINSDIALEDIGFFVIPLADNQTLNVNPAGPARMIYSGSQHIEEAKEYFEFLASQDSLQYMVEQVPKYNTLPFENSPRRSDFCNTELYQQYPDKQIVYQTAVKYVNPQWTEIGNDLTDMLQGNITPEQVLVSMDQRRAEQAHIMGDPNW